MMTGVREALVSSPGDLVGVAISTVVIYLVLVGIFNYLGQRLNASLSSIDVAAVAILGAIVGRTTLGPRPTLMTGLVALGTLFLLEVSFGTLRSLTGKRRPERSRAVAIMVAGRMNHATMKRYGITEIALWSTLRHKGVRSADHVALVILEPTGQLSVMSSGDRIDPEALVGVEDQDQILSQLASSGHPLGGEWAAVSTGSMRVVPEPERPQSGHAIDWP